MTANDTVALVTGASRGIGRAIAQRLATDGWRVVVNCRSDEQGAKETVAEIEAIGGAAEVVVADVTDGDQVDDLFERVGPVGVLVNNAGVRRDGLAIRMRPDDWRHVLETNLTGAFLTTRRALEGMLVRRWGRIVNVSSVVGVRGNAGQANYAAAKAGLVGMTRSVAREVAKRGITVNAVAPGFVRTALTEELPGSHVEALLAQTPLGREVWTTEVAAAVAFLASREAGAITGQVLCVDGGMTA